MAFVSLATLQKLPVLVRLYHSEEKLPQISKATWQHKVSSQKLTPGCQGQLSPARGLEDTVLTGRLDSVEMCLMASCTVTVTYRSKMDPGSNDDVRRGSFPVMQRRNLSIQIEEDESDMYCKPQVRNTSSCSIEVQISFTCCRSPRWVPMDSFGFF